MGKYPLHKTAGIILAAASAYGCSVESRELAEKAMLGTPAVVAEAFETGRDTLLNIDSPAIWHGPNGEHWILSTAKSGDVIRIDDAATGEFVRDAGAPGTALGQLRRPNGIAVLDDIVWIVERDNHRLQLLSLPDFRPLGAFGQDELILPYGLTIYGENGRYEVYITDNYELVEDEVPPDSALGRRVHHYRVTVDGGRASAEHVRAFGETSGPGVLRKVESIAADPANDHLLVAEELGGESTIKIYDLAGRFTGRTFDTALFPNEAEGIALYACGTDEGYWITTDQGKEANTFHIFDRLSFAHRGSFRGEVVMNTDGIALTQRAMPGFPAGAFFAVHDDESVVAFSWKEIADALGLRADCTVGGKT